LKLVIFGQDVTVLALHGGKAS